ncbi:ParM/StbA family protein [Floridanema aerugineum]|uniref:ParM/StbA family protein n=1 Tax=Floridaenema aerugineum BLCC-F46 TaxID=3153654 RepID=A0ABV4X2B0_9CYAN
MINVQQQQNHRLIFDFGNYDIKHSLNGSQPTSIRSLRFQLPWGTVAHKSSPSSPLIEYQGIRYHYGAKANEYRSNEPTVLANKQDRIIPALFACLPPLMGRNEYGVFLTTFHPMPEMVTQGYRASLVGKHEFKYNGEPMEVRVLDVKVLPEGLGSYLHAKKLGMVPDKGYTVLIDIGGGTWISRLFNEDGDIIGSTVNEKGGAFALAQNIAFDGRLRAALPSRPLPSMIMDGLANGTLHYGSLPVTWKDYYMEYLKPWFSSILAEVQAEYAPYFGYITRFILTGGSSLLVKDLVADTPMFLSMPDPRYANLLGILENNEDIVNAQTEQAIQV